MRIPSDNIHDRASAWRGGGRASHTSDPWNFVKEKIKKQGNIPYRNTKIIIIS
jgi:hypothetical protein